MASAPCSASEQQEIRCRAGTWQEAEVRDSTMEFHLPVRSWGSSCSRKFPNPLTSTLRHLWLATPVDSPSAMSPRSRRTPSLQPAAHRPANARALDVRYTVSGSHAELTAAARQLTHRCQPHQAASNRRRGSPRQRPLAQLTVAKQQNLHRRKRMKSAQALRKRAIHPSRMHRSLNGCPARRSADRRYRRNRPRARASVCVASCGGTEHPPSRQS